MRHDPDKHADEFPDFRGSTVCGFGLNGGGIYRGTVSSVGAFTLDRPVALGEAVQLGAVEVDVTAGYHPNQLPAGLTTVHIVKDRPDGPVWIRAT